MAAELKASFRLSLDDQVSPGIRKLIQQLERLNKLARSIKMAGLDGAERVVKGVETAGGGVVRKLEEIAQKARAAQSALGQMSSQAIRVNSAGVAFPTPMMGRAAMGAMMLAAAGSAAGGGGGRVAGGFGGGGGYGSPYLALSGPGGGLPPINMHALRSASFGLNGARMWGALQQGAARFGQSVAQAGQHVQALNQGVGHLAHAGVAAFATGFGLMAPIREYAKYENIVRHIAITAETPAEKMGAVTAELMQQYNKLALSTGQHSDKVAEAANFLITTGIGRKTVDALLPTVAQAATAYNSNIGDSVQAIFSLSHNLHVPEAEMPGTVSAMALAAKRGHFSFANFSQFLPEVAPIASLAGIQGAGGARQIMASLEVARANAGTPGEAMTNYRDFLGHLFGDDKRGLAAAFAHKGVDLNALMVNAEKAGIDPQTAVIAKVRQMTKGMTEIQTAVLVGSLFHNQQSRNFVIAMLKDQKYYDTLMAELKHADANTINKDFAKAIDAPEVQLRLIMEMLTQIERRFGEGFAPLLKPLMFALRDLNLAIGQFDKDHPGLLNTILQWVAGFAALAVTLGLAASVFGLMGNGLKLLLLPLRGVLSILRPLAFGFGYVTAAVAALGVSMGVAALLVLGAIALIAGGATLIYRNWAAVGPWFSRLWDAIKLTAWGFYEFLAGLFTGDFPRLKAGFEILWHGLVSFFSVLWEGIKTTFLAFVTWLDGWTGGAVTAAIDGIKAAWSGLTGFFTELIAGWSKPFTDFIDTIVRKIAELRALMGGGSAVPPIGGPAPLSDDNRSAVEKYMRETAPGKGADASQGEAGKVSITVGVDPASGRLMPRIEQANLPRGVTVGPDRGSMTAQA